MTGKRSKKRLGPGQRDELLATLKARFPGNVNRHEDLQWERVRSRLESDPEKLWSLGEMERTGGEPDVVGQVHETGEHLFFDCSAESPGGAQERLL